MIGHDFQQSVLELRNELKGKKVLTQEDHSKVELLAKRAMLYLEEGKFTPEERHRMRKAFYELGKAPETKKICKALIKQLAKNEKVIEEEALKHILKPEEIAFREQIRNLEGSTFY